MNLTQDSIARITDAMIDSGVYFEDIEDLANFINEKFTDIEVAVSQPHDAAEFHNLICLNQPTTKLD